MPSDPPSRLNASPTILSSTTAGPPPTLALNPGDSIGTLLAAIDHITGNTSSNAINGDGGRLKLEGIEARGTKGLLKGSGSVGVAAVRRERDFFGNDLCAEAVDITRARLRDAGAREGPRELAPEVAPQLGLTL